MKEPLLSIIVPHYENTDGLEILSNSIYNDFVANSDVALEVLIIDDYSCEKTKKL